MHAHHMQPSWYAIHTNEYAISSQKAYPVPRGCLCNPGEMESKILEYSGPMGVTFRDRYRWDDVLTRNPIPNERANGNIHEKPEPGQASIGAVIIFGMEGIQESTDNPVGGRDHGGRPDEACSCDAGKVLLVGEHPPV